VTFHGVSNSGTGAITFPGNSNGTYQFTVPSVNGFSVSPSTGSIDISGGNVTQAIVFTALPSSTSTVLGLPVMEGYALIGGILVAVAVVSLATVLLTRRRKGHRKSEDGTASVEDAEPAPEE
jgi:hypothetical protein